MGSLGHPTHQFPFTIITNQRGLIHTFHSNHLLKNSKTRGESTVAFPTVFSAKIYISSLHCIAHCIAKYIHQDIYIVSVLYRKIYCHCRSLKRQTSSCQRLKCFEQLDLFFFCEAYRVQDMLNDLTCNHLSNN
jgi:hypothetical protein